MHLPELHQLTRLLPANQTCFGYFLNTRRIYASVPIVLIFVL